MVWEAEAPHAGFSTGKPWLPVKPPQAMRAVNAQDGAAHSVLHFYREVIAFRKANAALTLGKTQFHDLPNPLLAFTRTAPTQTLTCIFNLGKEDVQLGLTGDARITGPHHATLEGTTLTLPGNGFVYLEHEGELAPTPT